MLESMLHSCIHLPFPLLHLISYHRSFLRIFCQLNQSFGCGAMKNRFGKGVLVLFIILHCENTVHIAIVSKKNYLGFCVTVTVILRFVKGKFPSIFNINTKDENLVRRNMSILLVNLPQPVSNYDLSLCEIGK